MTDTYESAIYADVHGPEVTVTLRAGWSGTWTAHDNFACTNDFENRKVRWWQRSKACTPARRWSFCG